MSDQGPFDDVMPDITREAFEVFNFMRQRYPSATMTPNQALASAMGIGIAFFVLVDGSRHRETMIYKAEELAKDFKEALFENR